MAEGDVEKINIGIVGVDSGQLMVCDPAYIDGEWAEEEVNYQDKWIDTRTNEAVISPRKLEGKTFESEYKDGMTYNEAIAKGFLERLPEEIVAGKFSYDGCCRSKRDKRYAQLNYKMGHPGVGVVFDSGFGDESYGVFATIKDFGEMGKRVVKVEIIMDDDELDTFNDFMLKYGKKLPKELRKGLNAWKMAKEV